MISPQLQCCNLAADFIEQMTRLFLEVSKYGRIQHRESYKTQHLDVYFLSHNVYYAQIHIFCHESLIFVMEKASKAFTLKLTKCESCMQHFYRLDFQITDRTLDIVRIQWYRFLCTYPYASNQLSCYV